MTQTDIKRKNRAMLLMVITAAMWSLGGIFIKLISWSPFLIAGIRSGISGSIMAMYMAATHTRFKLNKYSVLAGVGLAFSATLFTIANKLTTAANAIVLQYTAPIFILIISALFFKQKMQKQDVLVVCITMGGMVLFFLDQLSPGNMLGNVFGILAGIFLAQMFVMVGRGGDDDATRMSGIMIAHVLTLLIGLPIGIPQTTEIAAIEIVYVIILGVFQLGIPYVLYGIASRDCPPLACSLIGMLEPLLNPVWVAIFIGEVPGPFALVGAVIIIATVSWWCIKSR
ncbi:MAG: DMT family transporter [Clostridiales bacterium]|nr:DMT family transporter [Clostridiales bacterium]